MIKRTLFLGFAVLMLSCSTQKGGGSAILSDSVVTDDKQNIAIAGNKKATSRDKSFWGNLLSDVCENSSKENVCISPLSAQLAMAMVVNGAEGETEKEICNTMQIGDDANSNSKKMLSVPAGQSSRFEIANSIWINEKLDVKEEFIAANKEYFDALVERTKFDSNAVSRINEWCKEKTNGRIPSIIEQVRPDDMMYLLNAIYFKAGWRLPFSEENTSKQKFTTENGKEVEVEMMMQRNAAAYYSDNVLSMAAKDYNGGYKMLLVLPNEGVTCGEAAKYLARNFDTCMGKMKRCDLQLSLPKFTTEFCTSLKTGLANLGINRAFSKKAQFGGISDTPLFISDIMQKTFIAVNEKGTEATAVTSVTVGLLSARRPDNVEIITLDRPFIYAIVKNGNEVMFVGKVGNPSKEN